jgi:phage portal protein BeeE
MKLGKALTKRSSEGMNLTLSEYLNQIATWSGLGLPFMNTPRTTLGAKQEEIRGSFEGYAYQAMKDCPVIFSCMEARRSLFSEATFNFRRRPNGRPGQPFTTGALAPLQRPSQGETTSDLMSRMIQDVDLSGNWFGASRPGGKIQRLRPDWVTIILGSYKDPDIGLGDVDAEVLGYIYEPGGKGATGRAMTFLAHEVAHFKPIPDPTAEFRGMSWITPLIREIMGDKAMSTHKLQFFENGAVPGMVVNMGPKVDPKSFQSWIDKFEEGHSGSINAFKTIYLAAGAEAEVVGSDLKSIEFQAVQGQGEIRITGAAGVPAILVSLSEGLKAATLANYGNARRHFGDATVRPLWRGACGSLETIINVPTGAQLWYDASDISYLQEDEKDAAEIQFKQSEALKRLVEAGYTPESAIVAIDSNDLSRLEHSGLVSVQLHPPGSDPGTAEGSEGPPAPSSNE